VGARGARERKSDLSEASDGAGRAKKMHAPGGIVLHDKIALVYRADVGARAAASTTTANKTPSVELRGNVLDVLKTLLAEGQREAVLALFAKLVSRNSELEARLAKLLSGPRKNEGVSTAQLKLFLDSLEARSDEAAGGPQAQAADEKLRAASAIDEKKDEKQTNPARQPRLRQPAPPHLRRIDNPIAVPAAERACPKCGKERECYGHDVTEVVELIPAEVVVRVDKVEKLVCRPCDGQLVRAPSGEKVVQGGKLGPALVAQLIVDKYDDGLPLHRQKRRFQRMGLVLPVATLADQVAWATDLLRCLWRAAIAAVLGARVMHLDGTSLPVLDQEATGGKRLGALWGYVGDRDVAAYLFASTAKKCAQREGEMGPEDMLNRRTGFTVADASNLFDKSFKREDLIECGCNMHARRRFVEALDRGDARAALPIAAYKKLYEIEAEIRDKDEGAKLAARQARSKPVFDELLAWCRTYEPNEPPKSALGEAIGYLLNHHQALGRFLEHGAIPMDNGIVERLHVRAALTRKNFLFAGSDTGGERAAIAYTILACCRLAEVNPVEYLRDMLPRLAGRIRLRDASSLLPARWKAAREVAAMASAQAIAEPAAQP
jgi:transposase